MTRFPKKFLFFLLSTACFWGCQKQDELSDTSVIQTDKAEKTHLDKWLDSNFSKPYNIAVNYRWESNSFDTKNGLTPATPEKIRPALEAIAYIWGGTFMNEKTGGKDFIKKYAPRQLYIYGNGNPYLAQTASGNNIIRSTAIYSIDSFIVKDESTTRRLLWSFYNQYIKSLVQTVPFDRDAFAKLNTYKSYGPNPLVDLSSDAYYRLLRSQLNQGFFSAQGYISIEEDFAETITAMLMHSRREVEEVIKKAGERFPFSGEVQKELEKIRAEQSHRSLQGKRDFVINYFKEKFNMDFYRLQYTNNRRLQTYLSSAEKEE